MTFYPEPFVWKVCAAAFVAGFLCALVAVRLRAKRPAGLDTSDANKPIPFPLE